MAEFESTIDLSTLDGATGFKVAALAAVLCVGSVSGAFDIKAADADELVLTGGTIVDILKFEGKVTVAEGENFLYSAQSAIHAERLEVSGGLLTASPFTGGSLDTSENSITVSGGQLGGGLAIAGDETVTVTGGLFIPWSEEITGETIANLIQTGGEVKARNHDLTVTGAFTQTGGTVSEGTITVSDGTIGTGTFTQSGDGTIAAGTVLTADSVQLQGGTIAGTLSGPGAVTVSDGTTQLTGSIAGATDLTVAGGRLDATGTGTIDTASNTVTVSGGTLAIDDGAIASNETLVIEGGAVTGGNLSVSSVTQSGGLIAAGTTITTRGINTLSGGVIAGTLTGDSLQNGVDILGDGTTTLTGTGTIGGSIYVDEDATFDIQVGGVTEGEGFYYVNLGTTNNAGTVTTSQFLRNEGVLKNSGTINVGNSVHNFGTLQVDGTLTTGTLLSGTGNVNSEGGMITGSGVIDADVNLRGATIAPGNSPGTLTIDGNLLADASSVLAFELGGLLQGDDYDWLNVLGNVSLSQDTLFDIDYFGGFEAEAGDTFDILTGDSFSFFDLAKFDFADISTSGLLWSASLFDVGGSREAVRLTASSTVAPVPLPAALPLFLAGLAGLGFVGWRKNRRAAPPSAALV